MCRNYYKKFCTVKQDWLIKTREMFSFLPLINNSVIIRLSFYC